MNKKHKAIIGNVGHVINAWLPNKIKYSKVPGVVVGIVDSGFLEYENAFGLEDIEGNVAMNKHSLFHIASISKVFTAVAILQLVEKKKLNLDDQVCKYIPWFVGKNKNGDLKKIKIRNLLAHTAGVFRDGTTPHWVTGDFPSDLSNDFSNEALVMNGSNHFKYSNFGFALLGKVIESVAGESYKDYIQKNIFDVLNMKHTFVDYDPTSKVVSGYGREVPDQKKEKFSHIKTNAYAPATGFVSNLSDLSRFISALCFSHKGPQILLPKSKKQLSKPNIKTEDGDKYGFGVDVMTFLKQKVIGHSGGFLGSNTQIIIDQKTGLGVIVLTNVTYGSAHWTARGIMEAMFQLLYKEADYKSKTKVDPQKYEGLFRNQWGDEIVVGVKDILVGFSPETTSPFKYKTRLIPQKTTDHFLIKQKGVFGTDSETAVFKDFKEGKAQTVVFGASPMYRI